MSHGASNIQLVKRTTEGGTLKSFREHEKEVQEASKSEPSPEAVAKTQRVLGTIGFIVFVVGLLGLILASC